MGSFSTGGIRERTLEVKGIDKGRDEGREEGMRGRTRDEGQGMRDKG